MARREKTTEDAPPTDDDDFIELDGEYEFRGEKYGPGRVKIEGRQARRAILRAMENAQEELGSSAKEEQEAKAEATS
jgi:hypothetical protein